MKRIVSLVALFFLVSLFLSSSLRAATAPAEDIWPRVLSSGGTTITVYQPQLDSWDGFTLHSHAAVAVLPKGEQEPTYGVASFTARTVVDKTERLVHIEELRIDDAKFPSVPEQAPAFLDLLRKSIPKKVRDVSLDRLEADMAILREEKKGDVVPVRNDPPRIIFATKPSILVLIDGEPKLVPVKETKTGLWRVLNTRVLLLKDSGGIYYLHLFDGYMEASSLEGPWTVAKKLPKDLKKAEQDALESQQVDFLEGEPDPKSNEKPSLKKMVPLVFITQTPAELIVTDGQPNYVPIDGTNLLYVKNTTGNVFKDLADQKTYILVSGRWFRSDSIAGPWEYVPGANLPQDFARLPDDSPKENVKASIPGTPQAQEAVIANEIPQTAKVERDKVSFTPQIDGTPQLMPIEGTSLFYVVNSATPIIKVDEGSWYACQNGVWFVAPSLDGPWAVATSVPAVIYSIPTSSPLHYVTYVKVYNSTPENVYVGYTPGYMGTVENDGVVVYGTGYYYPPWIGTYWYGWPYTYGLGCSIAWTPWWGWSFGFGFGWGWGWGWWGAGRFGWYYPPAPWWGPYRGWGYHRHGGISAWGPRGWANTSGNIYHHWGSMRGVTRVSGGTNAFRGDRWARQYGTAYNSRTGTIAAGQRAAVTNVYTGSYAKGGRGAAYNRKTGMAVTGRGGTVGNVTTGQSVSGGRATVTNTRSGQSTTVGGVRGERGGVGRAGDQFFGTRDGNVYRRTPNGWEQVNRPSEPRTQGVARPQTGAERRPQDFSREQAARQAGQRRYDSFQLNRPAGGYSPQTGGYSRSSGGYSAPSGGYSRPSGGYTAPSGSYSRPSGGYSRPSGGYTAPSGGGGGGGGGGWYRGGGGGGGYRR